MRVESMIPRVHYANFLNPFLVAMVNSRLKKLVVHASKFKVDFNKIFAATSERLQVIKSFVNFTKSQTSLISLAPLN